MDLQLLLAIGFGKIIALILKLKGSGATAAPGLYALKIDPNLVKKLTNSNNLKSIVVSGTNGKTTTCRLIYTMLSTNYKIIHNRQGSNLLRGIASTLVYESSILGKLNVDLALWEADEAALLPISQNIPIDTLLLLNLFRDQLDRYGEINTTRKKWQQVIKNLSTTSRLFINCDDPSTNFLAQFAICKTVFFGVEASNINLPTIENVADVKYCINCAKKLTYQKIYSAHLGIYRCTNCNFKRNTPEVKATSIGFKDDFTTKLEMAINHKPLTINYSLPGLYNVYNTLAALSVCNQYVKDIKQIITKIKSFTAVFGRFQSTKIDNKNATVFLIKNPAGANEVIRTLAVKNNLNLLVALNDNIADGRDVSWIWDTNWESLKGKVKTVFIAGSRAHDMALRLKYANINVYTNNLQEDIYYSINQAINKLKTNDTLIILPTYTALLEVQKSLEKWGGEKWHQQ